MFKRLNTHPEGIWYSPWRNMSNGFWLATGREVSPVLSWHCQASLSVHHTRCCVVSVHLWIFMVTGSMSVLVRWCLRVITVLWKWAIRKTSFETLTRFNLITRTYFWKGSIVYPWRSSPSLHQYPKSQLLKPPEAYTLLYALNPV